MYELAEADLDIQARARRFADELIPFEVEAEMAEGELPAPVLAAHKARAHELGLCATNMPVELGGLGCTTLQQVLVQEQMGRVTNALGWVASTPPSWLPEVATEHQIEQWIRPTVAGRARGVLRDHRVRRGLRRRRHRGDRASRRRRLHPRRREVARHVVQLGGLRLLPGQAVGRPERRARTRCSSSTCPADGVSVVRTPAYSHTISHHHPIVSVRGGPGAGREHGRRGGRRHALRLRVVPVRADDGGRALRRCGATAGRGDDRVRDRAGGRRLADRRRSGRSRRCSPTA